MVRGSAVLILGLLIWDFVELRAFKIPATKDRETNEMHHAKLFKVVRGLQDDVRVLLDRSECSGGT